MTKDRFLTFLAITVLLTTLSFTPFTSAAQSISVDTLTAAAGPQLNPEITISANDDEQYSPSIAFNWKHHEYLVVWHDKWAIGTRDIRGARISEQGQLISEFTVYENPTRDSAQPSVEYDPVNDRYLVVWVMDAYGNGSDWDLYGRFVPWQGPDAGLAAFAISTWKTHQWNPKLAYGRAVEEFLVVWSNEYQTGVLPMYVSGRRVRADGSGFPGGGSDFTLSHPSQNRVNPDVTYNLSRNEYMVVVDNAVDIFGLRMTGNLGQNFGGEFGIAGWPSAENRPAVAACSEADQYLVAWQSDQGGGNTAIYARFLGGDGAPASVHLIDDTTSPEESPDVACSHAGTQYLVAWQTRYTNLHFGIWGRIVHPNGSLDTSFGLVQPGPQADRTNPVVAGGQPTFLVAWEHQRNQTAYQDIHGRLVTPYKTFVPMVAR